MGHVAAGLSATEIAERPAIGRNLYGQAPARNHRAARPRLEVAKTNIMVRPAVSDAQSAPHGNRSDAFTSSSSIFIPAWRISAWSF